MGYDVTFQLVDSKAVYGLFGALAGGSPPPASPFDRQVEAAAQWQAVRTALAEAPLGEAARALCAFAVRWSACALPHVSTRNLAVTHEPLRMPEELRGLGAPMRFGFGSPAELFSGLEAVRPGLTAHLPLRLDGNLSTGGFVTYVRRGASELRRFVDELPAQWRPRVQPLLALFRAAERAQLKIWEASDLISGPVVDERRLYWPGLDRFPPGGDRLSADEWTRLGPISAEGDLEDLFMQVAAADPHDLSTVPLIQAVLDRSPLGPEHIGWVDYQRFRPSLSAWLEATLVHAEVRTRSWLLLRKIERGNSWGSDTPSVRPLPEAAVAQTLAEARREFDVAVVEAFFDKQRPLSPEHAEELARARRRIAGMTYGNDDGGWFGEASIDAASVRRAVDEKDIGTILDVVDAMDRGAGVVEESAQRDLLLACWAVLSRAPKMPAQPSSRQPFQRPSATVKRRAYESPSEAAAIILKRLGPGVRARLAATIYEDPDPGSFEPPDGRRWDFTREETASVRPAIAAYLAAVYETGEPQSRHRQELGLVDEPFYVDTWRHLLSVDAERAAKLFDDVCQMNDAPDERVFYAALDFSVAGTWMVEGLRQLFDYSVSDAPYDFLEAQTETTLRAIVAGLPEDEPLAKTAAKQLRGPDALPPEDLCFDEGTLPATVLAERYWSTFTTGRSSEWIARFWAALESLAVRGHADAVVVGFGAWLKTHGQESRLSSVTIKVTGMLSRLARELPSALGPCVAAVDLAFAVEANPNFLYNAACAYATRGEPERAAVYLSRAIALDPTQADDARQDNDFKTCLDHPAFVALLK